MTGKELSLYLKKRVELRKPSTDSETLAAFVDEIIIYAAKQDKRLDALEAANAEPYL